MTLITENLKTYLIENCGVAKDATDDELRKAVGEAFANGKLTAEKFGELTELPEQKKANEFNEKLNKLADGLEALTKHIVTDKSEVVEVKDEKSETKETKEPSKLATAVSNIGEGANGSEGVRVKSAAEGYETTKTAMHYPKSTEKGIPHPLAGQRTKLYARGLNFPSDLDQALSGVWAKFQIMAKTPKFAVNAAHAFEQLSDHEKSLLDYLTTKGEWDDSIDEKDRLRIGYPGGIKTLIDDATSGGLEAAPIVFDDQVIQTPLLNGELFPLVNQVPIDRGRRIEGVATLNVTGGWGGVDATAISLFDTTAYVTAFDTTIYRWEGAIRIGLDFISDTPIDFNSLITGQYGQRLLTDLDNVIATGNGTTQPEGIVNSGATAVTWSSTTSLSNYEALRFAVAKAEHDASVKGSAVFCGNETSYSRAIGIPIGASDERRVFGLGGHNPDYDGYEIMQRPYKINESLTNLQVFYAVLARYRMYRRKGFTVRTSTEGDTLIRTNTMLIVVMARYGGQLERGAAAALVTDAET